MTSLLATGSSLRLPRRCAPRGDGQRGNPRGRAAEGVMDCRGLRPRNDAGGCHLFWKSQWCEIPQVSRAARLSSSGQIPSSPPQTQRQLVREIGMSNLGIGWLGPDPIPLRKQHSHGIDVTVVRRPLNHALGACGRTKHLHEHHPQRRLGLEPLVQLP